MDFRFQRRSLPCAFCSGEKVKSHQSTHSRYETARGELVGMLQPRALHEQLPTSFTAQTALYRQIPFTKGLGSLPVNA